MWPIVCVQWRSSEHRRSGGWDGTCARGSRWQLCHIHRGTSSRKGRRTRSVRTVKSPVKPTVGEIGEREIGEKEIGEKKIGKDHIGQNHIGEARNRTKHRRDRKRCIQAKQKFFQAKTEALQEGPSTAPSQDRNLRRPRFHFDRRDLHSFRGYCRGYDHRVGSPRVNTAPK